MVEKSINAAKGGAEALKMAADSFKGAKIIRWLAQRGLCPIWLYKKSLERQIEVSDVTAELEKKAIERRNELKRLEMRGEVALEIEKKQLECSGDALVRESTQQLSELLEGNKYLGYNALGMLPLEGRAVRSFAENAINQQANYEEISLKAIKATLENNNTKENTEFPSKDFEMLFWTRARNYSDATMQEIFAAILSEEINSPGSVSPRALSTISVISKHELTCLQDFKQYIFNDHFIIVFPSEFKSSGNIELEFKPFIENFLPRPEKDLYYLRDIGILNFTELGTCIKVNIKKSGRIMLSYCGKTYSLKNQEEQTKSVHYVELFHPYREIARLLPQQFNAEYIDKIKIALQAEGLRLDEVPN